MKLWKEDEITWRDGLIDCVMAAGFWLAHVLSPPNPDPDQDPQDKARDDLERPLVACFWGVVLLSFFTWLAWPLITGGR